jgi:hypothetical protein
MGDFNGDGKLDLAVQGGGGLYILPGNGDGSFAASRGYLNVWGYPAVGDFNGDGRMDIVVPYNGQVTTMLGGGPGPVSVTPASGTGGYQNQTFSLKVTDTNGAATLNYVYFLMSAGGNYPIGYNGCFVEYNTVANTLRLATDSESAWLGPATLGSGASINNSQCTVNAAGSSVTVSGNDMTVNLALSFNPNGGRHGLFLAADESLTQGPEVYMGTWTVLKVWPEVSINPNAGSAGTQTFALTVGDPNYGVSAIQYAYFLINDTGGGLSGASGCFVQYNRTTGALYLANDAATAWLGPLAPGSGSSISNSQCTLNPSASSVMTSGDNITINVALSFSASFAGPKTMWLTANEANGVTSGFESLGTWTVPGAGVPAAVSITPNVGSGAAQTFALAISDTRGAGAITTAYFVMNAGYYGSGGCFIEYNQGANTLWLATDAATAWLGPVTPGTGSSIGNSQCALDPSSSSVMTSGNNITINVALSFSASFAGTKTMWLSINDVSGAWSGIQNLGTWTVTAASGVPSAVSVTPASGSGSRQTFALTISDTSGAEAISTAYFLMNSALNGSNGCFIEYNRGADTLRLADDAATAWLEPVTPGTTSSIGNTQCTLNAAGSSVTTSGNTIIVNVALTLSASFGGAHSVWLEADDAAGARTGLQILGAWTVSGPSAVSITPDSGSGAAQTFNLEVSDTNLPALNYVYFLANSALQGAGGCFIEYNSGANTLRLANDSASACLGPITPGTASSINNSQCTLQSSAAVYANSYLFIYVSLTFNHSFAGGKTMWLSANESVVESGFQSLGTWTVP